MNNLKIKVTIEQDKKIYTFCRMTLKMLSFLDFITFRLIQDRLLLQAEKIIDLYAESIIIDIDESCP